MSEGGTFFPQPDRNERQSSLWHVAVRDFVVAEFPELERSGRKTYVIEQGDGVRPATDVEVALAQEVERLMRVYEAASDLCDDPFGSLDQRKFYALRESFYPTRGE